jgi:hypothetical protein
VDFCAELGLDRRVAAKEEDTPTTVSALVDVARTSVSIDLHQRGRRGLMTSDQKSHHLVDKFLVGEAAGFEGNGDNIDTSCLLLFHRLALAPDHIPASLLDEIVGFHNFLVSLVTVRKMGLAILHIREVFRNVWKQIYPATDVQNTEG